MVDFFSIDKIAFTILGYDLSYLELFGWLTGIVAVFLSAKANLLSWPIGIANVTLSFFLFYQVQLYPDMFLQVFFFVTNVIGWWRWANPRKGEEDKRRELKVSWMNRKQLVITIATGSIGTILMALFASNLHELIPSVFSKPSAAPFLDSFITVMSILATFYMVQKKVECWIIWLLVDIVATYVYFVRDLKFYSLLYFVFCIIASFAIWNWAREYKSYTKFSV
jgi:nicotinamide mononucleotide transporter